MKKLLFTLTLGLASSLSFATTYEVTITGPGGHSNGSYGNTNAVHAGARAVLALEKLLPCADVSDFRGGASVNAIAADAHFLVDTSHCSMSKTKAKEFVEKAVKAGADAENTFRGVKAGDMVRGFPADITYKIR
ncbi:MAG TPA: peptidase M20 [Sutterella sp.]|nr:peptidase M20 [Sutterella sp.]